ncbi:tautomerase family protein [Piscinibacter koreensis]|uniref:Tautomerase family protein n=1 Tax=Piscinibacter koreensis TaxID=2742824 RepID=A0A7Y6TWG2_9BURK|nr:4-oxalocrotonate tautomerase family protein [Schlegelella koreensis]NUZ06050.1 tautomerase family protein [Schlegelella koreensis]
MPIITVKVSVPPARETSQRIAATLGELTTTILGKDPNLIAIAIDHVAPADWYVGGRSLAEQGRHSVYVDIKVTDETNTKAEKARFIEAVFAAFEQLLGTLHEESYVHVHDVRAAAYGYGGRTQEYRWQHARDAAR